MARSVSSIYSGDLPVGQIVLHDIDAAAGSAFVAYHLFHRDRRGHGIGTQALRLVQGYVANETAVRRLYIGTVRTNVASQRLAMKCGFVPVGTMREEPINGLMFRWDVPPDR